MLVDTHCHLTSPELAGQADAVVTRARAAGVTRLVTVATDLADAAAALALLSRFSDLHLVSGIHPHEAGRCTADDLVALGGLLEKGMGEGVDGRHAAKAGRPGLPAPGAGRIVGLGETGLDFHYDFAPPARQEQVFRAQLELAARLNLPVVIHARESEPRVCDILAEYAALAGRVVFHCFSAGTDIARRALDLGCLLSFTGVVTFRNADVIRQSARYVPADRIMIETDAPWLSPEPVRKVRPNEPALLVHTARHLAELRGETLEALAAATTANAERFFGLRHERT